MIPITLSMQNKEQQKKNHANDSEEEETPMQNRFHLVNFNQIDDDETPSQQRHQGLSVFSSLQQQEDANNHQKIKVLEIADFDKDISENEDEDSAEEEKPPSPPRPKLLDRRPVAMSEENEEMQRLQLINDEKPEKALTPVYSQKSTPKSKQSDSSSKSDTDRSKSNHNHDDEPQAEPMGQFQAPNELQQSIKKDYSIPAQPNVQGQNSTTRKDENNEDCNNINQILKFKAQSKQSNSEEEFDIFSARSSSFQGKVTAKREEDEKGLNLNEEAKAIEKILPFGIVNPYGKIKQFWDIIMILLLVYTFKQILVLPVRLAFENDSSSMLPLDLLIDSLFFIDIVFNFLTAYEDERGIIQPDRKKIVINYLKGWFFIDFVSTFPLYLIMDKVSENSSISNYNNMLRFFRLPRIYKLAKVFRIFQVKKFQFIEKMFFFLRLNKEYTLILKFTLITLILIHIAGCLWYFIGTLHDEQNWIITFGLDTQAIFDQYIASIYFVLTVLSTVGYGNIVPTNNIEYIFSLIFTFMGVAFFAYVMGTLTFTFSKLSQKMTMIKEREIFFNELAHTYSLPYTTHERLLKSIQSSIFSNSNQKLELYQEESIFTDLPPLVQGLVCEFLFKDIIEQIRFFQGKPRGFLRKMFSSLTPTFMNLGDAIYFKGEPADYVYFVIKGRLATKCEDSKGIIRTLIHVEGSYFGEVDILVSRARGESAISEQSSEVWKIDKDSFLKLLNEFEDVKMEVLDHAIKKEKNRKSTAQIVKNKNFLELVGRNKQEEIQLTKSQLIDKVKEKMIQSLNELVREKSDDVRDIFKNVAELNLFIGKVQDYEKVKEKMNINLLKPLTDGNNFYDPEVEESLLKGLKIQAHLQEIQEYL